jgi:periplasmic divalent cation tolerance protein
MEAQTSCMVGHFMNKSERNVLIVLVTASSPKEAAKIGQAVVKKKVAACVNIVSDVTSIFRWQGKVQRSREALLLVKTTEARYAAVERLIRSLHSYEVPEIIALKISKGLGRYTAWVERETTRN